MEKYSTVWAKGNVGAARVMMQYLMLSMGYDVRMAVAGNDVYLMLPFKQKVYGNTYIPMGKTHYYVYPNSMPANSRIYSCALPEDEDCGRQMDLIVNPAEIANFQYDAKTRMMMNNSLVLGKEATDAKIAAGENYVVRIKIEPGEDIIVNDLIRGQVKINSSILDDKVLYKSADDLPTYHLANIVDDHLMEISHVIRGEEWLPSAPLHVLLYKYFGWERPEFAHLPLLLKPDGNGKLSKRDGDRLGFPVFPLDWVDPKTGDKSSGYREAGYFPEAVVNFLALLGWHGETDKEFFTMEELINEFSLSRVSKSGAKFDYEKGKWFNHEYLQKKSDNEIAQAFMPILAEKGIVAEIEKVEKVVSLTKARCNFVKDLWANVDYFFVAPTAYDEKTRAKRWKENSAEDMYCR